MKITSLKLNNFKNIEEGTVEFKNNLSGIYGPNGTGKTSIIEAIEIITSYYNVNKPKELIGVLKKKIENVMTIGKDTMDIELSLTSKEYEYKLNVEFKKDSEGNIFTEKEEFYFKENEPKRSFKQVIKVLNKIDMIIPEVFFRSNKKEISYKLEKEILEKKEIHLKTLLNEYNNFNSYISLVYKYSNGIEPRIFSKETEFFLKHWSEINETLLMIIVVNLKEQALYNLDLILPIKVHNDKLHGTFPVNLGAQGNIHDENMTENIEKIIHEVKPIFGVLVPKSELIIKKELIEKTEEVKKFAINIYIKREGKEIPVKNESTGIIKIISLLSALVYFVKDKKAIVVVDELDIHIFEYLLAIILQKMCLHAKGQLIFTAHNLLPMEKLDRSSIIITSKNEENVSYTYINGTSNTTNLRKKYLRSQSMWSERNIEPLLINESALDLFLRKLVR